MKLKCEFVASASDAASIPDSKVPEIAISGRSNVGKSSLINLLCASKKMARVSSKPGSTRHINFFSVNGDEMRLADLPGYGYSLAGKTKIRGYLEIAAFYLKNRRNLHRIFLLVDSRRGIGELDVSFITWLEEYSLPCQIILTKIDKLSASALQETLVEVERKLVGLEFIIYPLLCISNRNKNGLEELINEITKLAKHQPSR